MKLAGLLLKNLVSAVVFGGRSPLTLEVFRQLAESDHEVHLVTRIRDESFVILRLENGCKEAHECDLEILDKSISLANEIDNKVGGLDAVAFLHHYRISWTGPFKQFDIEVNTLISYS